MVRCDKAPNHITEEEHHGGVEHDGFTDGVDGIEAINNGQERDDRINEAFRTRRIHVVHQRANRSHTDNVGHQNRHHRQVREQRKLLKGGGACRQQTDPRLADRNDDQALDRRAETIELTKDTRIEALLRRQLEQLRDRELPTESTARARDHQEATDHAAHVRREHVRKDQA